MSSVALQEILFYGCKGVYPVVESSLLASLPLCGVYKLIYA